MRLTKISVEGIQPAAADQFIWDDRLPGFGLKITPKGRRVYIVQYRVRGRAQARRMTLGQHGAPWTTEKARAAAEELLLRARTGEDPAETQKLNRLAEDKSKLEATLAERNSFETVLDEFISVYAMPKNRSWADAKRVIAFDALPEWKGRPVSSITRKEVIAVVDRVQKRSPSSARAFYARLRRMFSWCVERQLLDQSPCQGMRAPPSVESRDRWLCDDEIRLLWQAMEVEAGPFEALFKLLLLTGQRREEVTKMRWSEINLAKREWVIPKERSKNRLTHAVDLSDTCVEILSAIRRDPRVDLVFTTNGNSSLSNHAKVRQRYTARMQEQRDLESSHLGVASRPIEPWRVHDLRRTAATGMCAIKTPPFVVELILNHRSGTRGGLVAVYQHYDHRDERKAALTAWSEHITAITAGIS